MTHKFLRSKHGGYFYRIYPVMPPVVDRSQKDLFSDLPDGVVNPPESMENANVKKSFHGKFISKEDGCITLLVQSEITFLDTIIDEFESRLLSSVVVIEVSEEVYKYPFLEGNIYIVTLNEAIAYERYQSGGAGAY